MKTDDNEERRKRIRDIAIAGAGITFGAYILKNSGSLNGISKFIDDAEKAVSSTVRDIKKVSFKDLDYSELNKIAKKNFIDTDSVWNTARRNKGIDIDYSRGLISSLLDLKKISSGESYLPDEMFDSHQKDFIMQEFRKKLQYKGNEFYKELLKLTDKTIDDKNMFFELGEDLKVSAVSEQFEREINGTLLEKEKNKIISVMEDAINKSEEMRGEFYADYDLKIKDQIVDSFREELKKEYSLDNKKDKFFKETLDRAATVKDLLDAYDSEKININNEHISELGENGSIIDFLKDIVKEDKDFENLVIDNATLRVNRNGEVYSTKALNDLIYNTKEGYSDTILGKLFFGRSFTDMDKAPDFFYLAKGSFDPILADLDNSKSGILNNNFFKLGNNFYKLNKDNELELFEKASDLYLMGGTHGSLNVLNNRMQGNVYEKAASNKLFEDLDINTAGINLFDKVRGFINKFDSDSSWKRKIVDRIFTPENYQNESAYSNFQFLRDIKSINSLYNARTFSPSDKLFDELEKVLSDDAKRLLDSLHSDNPAQYLNEHYNEDIINLDLKSLLNKNKKNISAIRDSAHIGSLGDKRGVNVLKYDDLLRREILKEAMLIDSRSAENPVVGYAVSFSKLNRINIGNAEKQNARDLFNWSILQKVSDTYSSSSHALRTHEQTSEIKSKMASMLLNKNSIPQIDAFMEEFRKGVSDFIKNNTSLFDSIIEPVKSVERGFKNKQWVTMRKTINPLDIIKDLNDHIRNTENEKNFIKQFYAGRNNKGNITTASFIPYHLLNRLVTPLETVGLGFSNKNTGSSGDYLKNIILKRILPAAGAAYALSYLNFESENITGKSLTQDYYSFTSNFGLGVKTIQRAFGMEDMLRSSRMYNPIVRYWFGEYKDKDEYEDYLENGYDPVRKGRWWNFGSASEFRGGKISYWTPNNLRKAYSHYKDVSLYGSVDEKWKHSWIPTPRHPLAPLRNLLDPYWLEEKHYWDRPYPLTGDLFPSETPWGAVLNSTVGQIIKPTKRMHQKELQGTLTDVRMIIAQRNKEIKERASQNRLVLADKSGFTPIQFAPSSMPTLNEAVYSIHISHGKIMSAGFDGQHYADNKETVTDPYVPLSAENIGISPVSGSYNNRSSTILYNQIEKDGKLEQLANTVVNNIAGIISGRKKAGEASLNIIANLNNNIKSNAVNNNENYKSGVFIERARLYQMPFKAANEKTEDKYLDKMNIQNFNTKNEYVNNLMYSVKELTGMYGFLFESVLPSSHGYKLAQAGRMNSFVRNYWDSSFGGHGGDVMEIARRFFPHQNHDIEEINPIRNTMPMWLPERFWTGDPYTKLPEGEARLPGKGYESLNRLHSDIYGRYGAFDRYKILADVSPGSDEYKIWKKIAKEEMGNNPELIKQMAQIEKRVAEQSKEHDFYDYLFLGQKLTSKRAAIDKVSNDGTFTITGSDVKYQIAGVKPEKNYETKQSYIHDYLKPGMLVTLKYDSNKYNRVNSNGNISTIVEFGGTNISKQMFEDKKAVQNKQQDTLADKRFAAGSMMNTFGPFLELISHAQIPYIHNKYLRIDSPLESYKKEQIYGTTYSTWAHPIKGYIKPTFQSSFARSPLMQPAGIGAWYLSEKASKEGWKLLGKGGASHALFAFTNPGALAGGIIGFIPKMNMANHSSKIWNTKNGARIGAAAGIIGYGLANLNNPILSTANFAVAGAAVANQLKYTTKAGETILGAKGALIGAGIGLGLSAIRNPSSLSLSNTYIPKDTRKKWEIEEYYDRLEYLKYINLYRKAARIAKWKEGVDVHKIVSRFEYARDENKKVTDRLVKKINLINNSILSRSSKEKLITAINYKINSMNIPEQYFKMGKYAKAAIAYKKAADTTIYGLSSYSTNADILRALPKYDRDYFIEFSKEKDPQKQKKIEKTISPYKKKALELMWGREPKKQKTNDEFFSTHKLPNIFWSGWNPDENLENVKMKTIHNEGMLLSDFGIYDSQSKTPEARNAPEIKNINQSMSPLALKSQMMSLLNGIGLDSVDVSVETSMTSGLQIVANLSRTAKYNMQQKINNIFNNVV